MKTLLIVGILFLGISGQAFSMGHPHNMFAARKQNGPYLNQCLHTTSVKLPAADLRFTAFLTRLNNNFVWWKSLHEAVTTLTGKVNKLEQKVDARAAKDSIAAKRSIRNRAHRRGAAPRYVVSGWCGRKHSRETAGRKHSRETAGR
ncbi:hypothetical protein CWM47_33650 [Spirosoma pollinicola]|uniref:Uncharacterized protein n=1 Tax=Spirosoma pollinicola TaxID=2057025 RepID=A0A2K8Z909_9BACT|nr:hypothetical protein CWM47_33650 [Spirosoma pollinicola]